MQNISFIHMCGVLAITGNGVEPNRYNKKAMLAALSSRGPDGEGELSFPSCWLGHRRLSIIDLATGAQPMASEALAVTFNGEIYNYLELRGSLERRGHRFATNSDTEVILKSYKEYGERCVEHLDGMFAFALWDNESKKLFLARDRFGKKPLYYCFDNKTLIVASEIKALLASGKIKGRLSRSALDNYLQLGYVPPWKSIYENIFQLPPAHAAVFANGELKTRKYWALKQSPVICTYEEAKEESRQLLKAAVKKRLLASDVEVGAFLSGGVDSTIISLIAHKYLTCPLKTFSLGYGEYINELPYAQKAAEEIGSNHRTIQASENIINGLETIMSYFDEPHADTADVSHHLISQFAASNKIKVVLSGDGSDEIFMGYEHHARHRHISYKSHLIEKIFLNPFQGRVRSTRVFRPIDRLLMWGSIQPLNRDIFADGAYLPNMNAIEKMTAFDLTTYLPGQLLVKADRGSMMHGLEVRSPFLDTALVEFVCNLPVEFRASETNQKRILKDLLLERMPHDFVNRRKRGFGAPLRKWLREPAMRDYIFQKLGRGALIRALFIPQVIDILLSYYKQGDKRVFTRLWVLLCLEMWMEAHQTN